MCLKEISLNWTEGPLDSVRMDLDPIDKGTMLACISVVYISAGLSMAFPPVPIWKFRKSY